MLRAPLPLLAAAALVSAACRPPAAGLPQPPRTLSPTAATPSAVRLPGGGIAAKTAGMLRRDGFIPVITDRKSGKILLELPRDSMRALLFTMLATGLGSNPIGLDRGTSGSEEVVRFDRAGDRVLVVFENWRYRSSARDNPAHQRTVAEAFPPSTVAALPLLAEDGSGGRLLIDATDLFLRDWMHIGEALSSGGQGVYAIVRDRSSVVDAFTKAFPTNTEVDVGLTFVATGEPGRIVQTIVPEGRAFTLRQHVSLLELPNGEYRPRVFDPRVGYFGIEFMDYAQPIQLPLQQRWIARHRLERADPSDPTSPIKNPIVYYVDRGIPEPIRTATLQGVKWWEEAFDRAGLAGGFRAELLPEGADPMDARYNVVQWENRNERGWSVGGSLGDPRTGEIIKGMARLDSHRARTDYNLYAGLVGADRAGGSHPAGEDTAFVLARVRQVSAHEVGHTLGLAHNYIASTYERGSVMDYPPPRVRLGPDGQIDLSQAYAVGPGAYDVWAIRWGYGIFPPASEQDSLASIVAEGLRKGYLYLSDADARPEFGSDPRVNLWDDRPTVMEFLKNQMDVRRLAMARFGERAIRPGQPLALLQERFAPVYFMHRFAINAASKAVGGMEYSNAVRGDRQQATRPVPAVEQRAALALLVDALQPAELAIPDTVVTLLAPGGATVTPPAELFGSRTRPVFDELGAARTLAQMIVDAVLQRDRAARLVQQALADPSAPDAPSSMLTLSGTIDALLRGTEPHPPRQAAADGGLPPRKAEALRRVAQRAVADRLLMLAADVEAAPEVRAMAELKIGQLRDEARQQVRRARDDAERAHWMALAGDCTRWIERRELPRPTPALPPPPGDPFGG